MRLNNKEIEYCLIDIRAIDFYLRDFPDLSLISERGDLVRILVENGLTENEIEDAIK